MSLGFSISELIVVAGKPVQLHNGFYSEHGSVKELLIDLIHHLDHFKHNLENLKKYLDNNGVKKR